MKAASLVSLLVDKLVEEIGRRKVVGGPNVPREMVSQFVSTLIALGNVSRYDSSLFVDDVPYALDQYAVDGTIGKYLMWPREVTVPSIDAFNEKDVRDHYDPEDNAVVTPADFASIQATIFSKFRKTPSTHPAADFIGSANFASCDLIEGEMAAVKDLAHISALPYSVKIAGACFDSAMFNVPVAVVVKSLVTNLVTDLITKG